MINYCSFFLRKRRVFFIQSSKSLYFAQNIFLITQADVLICYFETNTFLKYYCPFFHVVFEVIYLLSYSSFREKTLLKKAVLHSSYPSKSEFSEYSTIFPIFIFSYLHNSDMPFLIFRKHHHMFHEYWCIAWHFILIS